MKEPQEFARIQTEFFSRQAQVLGGSGSIEKRGHGKLSPAELIPTAIIATAQVISAAIYRGKLPDWFDEELGP